MKKIIIVIIMTALTLMLSQSCHSNTDGTCKKNHKLFERVVPIEKLLECPQEYSSSKPVKIQGVVSDPIGIGKKSWFIITDETGSINVHGDNYIAPAEGATIMIEGTVKQGFSFKERRHIVFEIAATSPD